MSVVLILNRERHAASMTRWGVILARGLSTDLHLVVARGEQANFTASEPSDEERAKSFWVEVEEGLLDMGLPPVRPAHDEAASAQLRVNLREVQSGSRSSAVLQYIDEARPSLLVVGRQLSARSDQAEEGRFARELFDTAPCPTLLLRLGNHEGRQCRSLLAPTRGGDQAHPAVSLAHRLVKGSDTEARMCMTVAIVEPEVGDDGRALGDSLLQRALQRSQVDREDKRVDCKVILSNRPIEALADEADRGAYDLILLGATNSAGLRRRLFGTVPDRLMNRKGGLAVGVVRDALPTAKVLRSRLESWWRGKLPPLDREQRVKVFERLQLGSSLSLDFLVLISLSTIIAAFGLAQSSPAVVIGAMLVAPLMTPLLGAGLGLVQGNLPMIRTCFLSILVGFLLAFAIGGAVGLLTSSGGMTSELLGRCRPGGLDLGVAFFSGMAASYCLVRPGLSSALAGVAIAAALVPPIATSGIVLSRTDGGWDHSAAAALLFGTNVVAIILGAALTFFAIGIRGSTNERSAVWGRRLLLLLLLALAALGSYFLLQSRALP